MEKYIGVKIIKAEPKQREWARPVSEGHESEPKSGVEDGYKVEYEDGYISWSPKDVFEKAYRRTNALTFGLAIEALKMGKKVCREGWNGKGMFLYYVGADSYPAKTEIAKESFPGGMVPYGAYIAMKTAQGNVVPWLASQTDVLGEDWCILD